MIDNESSINITNRKTKIKHLCETYLVHHKADQKVQNLQNNTIQAID